MNVKHDIVVKIKNNNINEEYKEAFQSVENALQSVTNCTENGTFSLLCHLYFKCLQVIFFFKLKNLKTFFLLQAAQIWLFMDSKSMKLNWMKKVI